MPQKVCCTLIILAFSLSATAQGSKPLQPAGSTISIKTIPGQFYTSQLSPVCKGELLLQKKTGLPIFIRLGSKAYVDYLEQKPNAVRNW